MHSLSLLTTLLQLSLLTTNAFSCRGSGNYLSSLDSSIASPIKRRGNNRQHLLRRMLQPSSQDDFIYSPVDTMVIAASPELYEGRGPSTDQQIVVPQIVQHELSPQQFVYVILTRWEVLHNRHNLPSMTTLQDETAVHSLLSDCFTYNFFGGVWSPATWIYT